MPPLIKTDDDGRELIHKRELARRMGVAVGQIGRYVDEGMPVAEPGRQGVPSYFIEADCKAWKSEREARQRAKPELNINVERARRERAQALLAEQTVAQRAGELTIAREAAAAWAAEVAAVRTHMLAWTETAAAQLTRAAQLEGEQGLRLLLDKLVREALQALADGEHVAPKRRRAGTRKK